MSWKKAVSSLAPLLGAAIGGPFGGMAAKIVTDALGLPDNADESQIEQALQQNPEALAKVKQAEFDFKAKLKELDIKKAELVFKDTDSARHREISLGDYTPKVLALLVTIGFFSLLGAFMFIGVPTSTRDILNVMIGALGTAWVAIINYYFGSSHGSAQKNILMSR